MKTKPITRFLGLNNVFDDIGLGLAWLRTADNIDVNSRGKPVRREGYQPSFDATPRGAYATRDEKRLYVVDGDTLKAAQGIDASGLQFIDIATGLAAAPMRFAEVNGDVLFTNGYDDGIVKPSNEVLPWSWPVPDTPSLASGPGSLPAGTYSVCCTFLMADGRETGAGEPARLTLDADQALRITGIPQVAGWTTLVYLTPANGTDGFRLAFETTHTTETWNSNPAMLGDALTTLDLDPLPDGATMPEMWRGRVWVLQYLPEDDITAVWASEGMGWHLFSTIDTGFTIHGEPAALAGHPSGLIVATTTEIHVWDGETLTQFEDYGCVPGHNWDRDDDKSILLWTTRGLCRGLPLTNLTEDHVSVAPGTSVGAAIVRTGGQKRFIASLQQGGSAFNSR